VGKFIAGADTVHSQILIGADGVARPEPAHQQHDLLAVQARFVFIDNGLHDRLVFGNGHLDLVLDGLVETRADCPQTFPDLGRAEEVELQPGDAVLLFHDLAHVVHGTVAVDQVKLDGMGGSYFFQFAIAGPDRFDIEADLLQQRLCTPHIATDVVIADEGDIVGALRFGKLTGTDNVVANGIVGDVVSQRLGDTAEPLAVAGDDRQVQLLG